MFVDGVTQSLSRADFMLIIAGDGIRKEAQGIVSFLDEVGHMRFVLALVEIAVYKHSSKKMFIIQPRTLAKTQKIERRVEYSYGPEALGSSFNISKESEPWRQQYKEYWTRFIDTLSLDDPEQPIANPVAAGNITFSLPPSGAVAWLTVYFYKQNKNVGCYVRLINKPTGQELYQSLAEDKKSIEADLPFTVSWDDEKRIIERNMPITGDWPPIDNKEVDSFLSETINSMINTFRPRLERLSGN